MTTDAAPEDSLRDAILRGEYVAGQRLVEADLCERFEATRFVIRTALQHLSAQGLVSMERNRGARVRSVSLLEAIQITEVRRELEGLCAARAAVSATKSDRAELRQITRDMRVASKAGEPLAYSDLNAALHGAVRRIAAHETAARLIEQLRGQMVRHQFQLALLPGRPAVSLPQHEAIVAAIVAGDPDAASQAMRAHIDNVIEALQALPAARVHR
ncbi:MAG TPA: GntR family transcriptional regulator [Mycobacteriales bacterium]|nr:GntR family transcriptional regulator [Mycobacteriales bacterium]